MNPRKKRRLAFAVALLLAGGVAATAVILALRSNILFFYSPSEITEHPDLVRAGQAFRIGGLVQTGSVKRANGLLISFAVTDGKNTVPVQYSGVLPDLFHEGRGVVAFGTRRADGVFAASEVLAKHDEKYMPPEVVDALKKSGRWQESGT